MASAQDTADSQASHSRSAGARTPWRPDRVGFPSEVKREVVAVGAVGALGRAVRHQTFSSA